MNFSFAGAIRSKTMWVSVLTTALGIIQFVSPIIPPAYTPVALAVVGLIGAILRPLTTKPLSEKVTP